MWDFYREFCLGILQSQLLKFIFRDNPDIENEHFHIRLERFHQGMVMRQ